MNEIISNHHCTHLSQIALRRLKNDLFWKALSIDSAKEYCAYMFRILSEYLGIDSASLQLCQINQGQQLVTKKGFYYKQTSRMADSYAMYTQYDFYLPKVISKPRIATQCLDYVDVEQYSQTPFYLKHCFYFNVHNTMSVSVRIPNHENQFLILNLYTAARKYLFSKEQMMFIENVFLSLSSILFYKLDLICVETMKQHVGLLDKFDKSPELLRLIRLIIETPQGTSKEYAKQLGKSPKTVQHQLERIYQILEIHTPSNITSSKNHWNQKIELFDKFYFLRV